MLNLLLEDVTQTRVLHKLSDSNCNSASPLGSSHLIGLTFEVDIQLLSW